MLSAYGLWAGLVYRRWNVVGLVAFTAVQVLVLVAAALVITWLHGWSQVADFVSGWGRLGVTGGVAVLAALFLAAGYTTIRRVTV